MMDRKEALDFLMAFACCTSSFRDMCGKCPWNGKYECVNSKFEADLINEAVDVIRKVENKNMRKMKLSDIKISSAFLNSTPSENKMKECRDNWNKWHRQDRYLVVDNNNYLQDGYVMYLVLKENGIEEAEIKIGFGKRKQWRRRNINGWKSPKYREQATTYIYGVHLKGSDQKERVWRVPNSWKDFAENVQVGDTISCNTIYGKAPIVVTRVETLDKCPVEFAVKKVASRVIRRNGENIK